MRENPVNTSLIRFDFRHKVFAATLLLLFSLFVAFKVHGFSIGLWHDYIDHSQNTELVAGAPKAIRSDDALLVLPYILSQAANTPPFGTINPIAPNASSNMKFIYFTPVAHPFEVFRPQTIGYFFDGDLGLAWHWWYLTLGLLYSSFLVFLILSKNRFWVALFAAIAVTYAPALQFWSLILAPLLIASNFLYVGILGLLYSATPGASFLYGLIALWAGGTYLTYLYPPVQISLAYLLSFLLIGTYLRERSSRPIPISSLKITLFVLGSGAFIGFAYQFINSIIEPLRILAQTSYPGLRVVQGGATTLVSLFNNFVLPWRWTGDFSRFGGNICEAAGGFFLFPISASIIAHDIWKRRGKSIDPLPISILCFIALSLLWMFHGFGSLFAHLSLWDKVPEGRLIFAFVFADIALLVALSSSVSSIDGISVKRRFIIGIAWFTLLCCVAWRVTGGIGHINKTFGWTAAATLMLSAIGFLALRNREVALAWIAGFSFLATAQFNPLSIGGAEFLHSNPLSKTILEMSAGKKAVWTHFGTITLGNLFRVLGLPSPNGIQYYPQFSLWEKLDRSGKNREIYNRYAHVVFEAPASNDNNVVFSNPQADVVSVKINPDSEEFQSLNSDFVLVTGDPKYFLERKTLQFVSKIGSNHIFRVRK